MGNKFFRPYKAVICSLQELNNLRRSNRRLIGVDFGDKKIGLSLSDLTWTIASPIQSVDNCGKEKTIRSLLQVLDDHKACGFVFGYPLNMNGSEGPQALKVRDFVDNLIQHQGLPVLLWDERLSTQAVTRIMLAADLSRKRQKTVVDKMAASYILQGVLDALSMLNNCDQ